MTNLGIPASRELAKRDFLDRPLTDQGDVYCLGEFWYRQGDAAEFLQFLQFMCLNQRSAAGVLRLMGARAVG
ncbi:hypothetical protein [Loigolactobacillus jiayinensis]|uniref:Uncharacterized protein n=1 Tax=Loigolactobacillus jiayinensis TaxID=2486016 RepID=A0ABW1R8Z5_9LACO|nr:hypothetical protein [Loigolactobacillus jiayinensis]